MNNNFEFKEILSITANTITIVGLVWASIYGLIKKHKSLIGFKINDFIASLFKLSILMIVGIIVYFISTGLYLFILIITKGDAQIIYWENGKEIAHIISYFISIGLGLTIFWILSTIIWTGSFKYIRDIWANTEIRNLISKSERHKNLIIIKAEYKTANASKDVTGILNQMINNNELTIKASNELAGDPERNIVKDLEILYRYGNKPIQKVQIKEGKTITIKDG